MGKVIEMPRSDRERWQLVARSADRVLLVSGRAGAEDVALVRSLRAEPRLAGVPLMVLAPGAPPARIEQLLDSGASIVFNADVFSRAAR